MLGKLLKYEFKATARLFIFMYAGLILVAAINMGLLSFLGSDGIAGVASGLMLTFYIIATVAMFVVTLIVIIIRFYRNQLGDEGYLMFTLPVGVDKHILSKLIAACAWIASSFIVCLLSVMILTATIAANSNFYGAAGELWRQAQGFGAHPWLWLICIVVYILVSFTTGVITYYCAMAIGPNIIKNRLGGSILAYIIIYVASQIVNTVVMFAITMPILAASDSSIAWVNSIFGPQFAPSNEMALVNSAALIFFLACVFMQIVIAVPCYILTRHFLKNKLNLG